MSKKQFLLDKSSIVTVSSISSVLGLKSKLAYSSSKAALDSSVRSLAAELSNRGIRVNSILKGGLSTDFEIDYIKNVAQFNSNKILERQLLGLTTHDELNNFILFLLSDLVLTITGQNIILDGGYTL
jgi:NAD(P)-dependent dehydrogenase (short-subunit alcohol dehydrogenase family)